MVDFGVEILISLREATGDKDPALIFSFWGLEHSDLVTTSEEPAFAAFEDAAARVAANVVRVVEAVRLRKLGVFSRLASPFRDGHEFKRGFPKGLLNIGPLLAG